MKRVAVLGGGSWGSALASVLSNNKVDTSLWVRDKNRAEDILKTRVNKKYLPGVILDESIKIETDLRKAVLNKDFLLIAVPTHQVRYLLESIKGLVNDKQIFINVAKGIENDTLERISQIAGEIFPNNIYTILSGPSHAEEVGRKLPTTVVVASEDEQSSKLVQDLFMNDYFRVYTSKDVLGVELGGALKNIIALAAGISDGLGFGDNTKAALMTRGIYEMAKLGEAMGAIGSTFAGLSGIGDLIVTCTSNLSRNRRAGLLIGEGYPIDQVSEKVGMVVEGMKTTKSAYDLASRYNIEMPITEELYGVLYEGFDIKDTFIKLMRRERKEEIEGNIFF